MNLSRAVDNLLKESKLPELLLPFQEELIRILHIAEEDLDEEILLLPRIGFVLYSKFSEIEGELRKAQGEIEGFSAKTYLALKEKYGKSATEGMIRSLTILEPEFQTLHEAESKLLDAEAAMTRFCKLIDLKRSMLEQCSINRRKEGVDF